MKVFIVLLLAGACIAAPEKVKLNRATSAEESKEVEDTGPVGKNEKGETGEDFFDIPTTDEAEDSKDYLNDGTLDNLKMYYDCSGFECVLKTGKGENIGKQIPKKGDLKLTRELTPTLDMMAASLRKIKAQNNMLATLQKEMEALNNLGIKGKTAVSKGFAPIVATKSHVPYSKGLNLEVGSKGKGSANINLMREAAMCPLLKFEASKYQTLQYETKKQLDSSNAVNAMLSVQKAKMEQNLQSSELLREASKTETHKAAAALMMEKQQNDMLKLALAKESSEKTILEKQKENLEKQVIALQAQLRSVTMSKMLCEDNLKKTEEQKGMCLIQLMDTKNAYDEEKAAKEIAQEQLAKTSEELTLTNARLNVETTARKQCETTLNNKQAELFKTQEELTEEKAAHAKTQEELEKTANDLRKTANDLAIETLKLEQTKATLAQTENALIRTQATLELTEDKLKRTMDTLDATREQLRATKDALELEKTIRAAKEEELQKCEATLAATEAANQELKQVKQQLEDDLSNTRLALLDMTTQKNQMESRFNQAMKLLGEEKTAKVLVEANLSQCEVTKSELSLQVIQAMEMFNQVKKANEDLNVMFEQVKAASALIQIQLDKFQMENIELQAQVDKLRRELEGAVAMAAGCPPGYEKFSGSCYKYIRTKMPWKDGQRECMIGGGNMAAIETVAEQKFMVEFLQRQGARDKDTYVHVGGYKENFLWKWLGSGLIVGKDTPDFWVSEAAKSKDGCMEMYLYNEERLGKYTSRKCDNSELHTFVCERNIVPPGMTKPTLSEMAYLMTQDMPAYLEAIPMYSTKGGNKYEAFNSKSAPLMLAPKGITSKSAVMLAARLAGAKAANTIAAHAKASNLLAAATNIKAAQYLAANAKAANNLATMKAANTLAQAKLANQLATAKAVRALANTKSASLLSNIKSANLLSNIKSANLLSNTKSGSLTKSSNLLAASLAKARADAYLAALRVSNPFAKGQSEPNTEE